MAGMLKPSDVAAQFNCSAEHVRKLCRSGQLKAMRLGSDWRISPADLEAFEAGHTSAPAVAAVTVTTPTAAPVLSALPDLPAGYVPVFPEAWGLEPTAFNAASPAAGSGRTARTKKAALSSN